MKNNISNKIDSKQLALIIGIVVVVGLVAGIIGAGISGNVIKQSNNPYGKYQLYTTGEINAKLTNLTTNQKVLSMLSNCTHLGGEYGLDKSCNQVCKTYNKKCLLGQYFAVGVGERQLTQQMIIGCADIPNQLGTSPATGDTGLWCVCC